MPRPPKYTDAELLDEIRRLADGDEPPTKREMNADGKHSARTFQDRWGSWSNAVDAAGFEPRDAGEEFAERPAACPLCDVEQGGLDFHHWRYGENEVGCYLCRECHDIVHSGAGNRSNPDWLVPAVENLITAHQKYHDGQLAVDAIVDRYNLDHLEPLVVDLVADTRD